MNSFVPEKGTQQTKCALSIWCPFKASPKVFPKTNHTQSAFFFKIQPSDRPLLLLNNQSVGSPVSVSSPANHDLSFLCFVSLVSRKKNHKTAPSRGSAAALQAVRHGVHLGSHSWSEVGRVGPILVLSQGRPRPKWRSGVRLDSL